MEYLADPFLDGSYSLILLAETNAIGHDWKSFVPGQGYSIKRSDATSSQITAMCGAWSSLVLAVRPPVKSTWLARGWNHRQQRGQRPLNPFDSTQSVGIKTAMT